MTSPGARAVAATSAAAPSSERATASVPSSAERATASASSPAVASSLTSSPSARLRDSPSNRATAASFSGTPKALVEPPVMRRLTLFTYVLMASSRPFVSDVLRPSSLASLSNWSFGTATSILKRSFSASYGSTVTSLAWASVEEPLSSVEIRQAEKVVVSRRSMSPTSSSSSASWLEWRPAR